MKLGEKKGERLNLWPVSRSTGDLQVWRWRSQNLFFTTHHDSPHHRWYWPNGTHPLSSSQWSKYLSPQLFSKRYCTQAIQSSEIWLVRRKDIQEPFQGGSQNRPSLPHRAIGHGPVIDRQIFHWSCHFEGSQEVRPPNRVTNRNWIASTDGEGPRVPVEH